MAQIKLEAVANYFIGTDVATSTYLFDSYPTKDIRYELKNETVFFYDINTGLRHGHKDGYYAGLTGTVNLDSGAPTAATGIITIATVL